MKAKYFTAAILAACLTTGSAFAQQNGGGGGGGGGGGNGGGFRGRNGPMAAPAYQNPYEDMLAHFTALTDDQKAKLKDKTDTTQKDMEDFNQNAREQLQDLRENGGNNDPDAMKQMADAMQKLHQDGEALLAKDQAEIDSILTPEQAADWEGYQLGKAIEQRLMGVQLTDDEKTKIEGLAKDAGKDMAAAKDAKDRTTVRGKLIKKIVTDVLTDEQVGNIAGQQGQGFGGGRGGFGGGGGQGQGQGGGRRGGGQRGGGQGAGGQGGGQGAGAQNGNQNAN